LIDLDFLVQSSLSTDSQMNLKKEIVMRLIYSPASPFVRKVVVLMYEAGLSDKVTLNPVATTALNTADDARAANPLGKIPALVRDGDSTIFDSRVICRYLDDLAGSNLYPADRLWDVLTLEALADGIMESAVSMVYEVRLRPENEQSPAWIDAQWSKVTHALAALEADQFAAATGDVNMGQLAVACALGYLDFRHAGRNWQADFPKLAAWQQQIGQRASMMATTPAG
jgi:glutathione S-transferase